MAALTGDVIVTRFGVAGDAHQLLEFGLGASVTIYRGSIALTASTGYLKNASSPASTDTCWGLIDSAANIANDDKGIVGTASSGGVVVNVATGTFFLYSGTSGDALTVANLGAKVYVIDEVTVGATSNGGTRPVAGTLVAVDTSQPGGYAVKLGVGGP